MRIVLCLSLVALICSGCAGVGGSRPTVNLTNSFDPAKVAHIHMNGTNTIKGSGVIRQAGGGAVTAAGCEVSLNPVTAYSDERAMHIYGNLERGYKAADIFTYKWDPPTPQEYRDAQRTTVGDAQGFFEFRNVPDGLYRVAISIVWSPGDYRWAGGALMQQVTVSGGETVTVVLAP